MKQSATRITYHPDLDSIVKPLFDSELGPCPFIIPSREDCKFFDLKCKHYADYCSIHTDLKQALEILNKFQSKKLKRKKNEIIRQTLWKYSVSLIGRTFTKGDNRNVNLQKQNFTSLSETLKQTLDKVLHLRHNLVSHQGQNDMEYHDTFLVLRPGEIKQIVGLEYLKMHAISPSDNDIDEFRELIIELIDWTENKINDLREKILDSFSKVDIEDIYLNKKI